MHIEQEKERRNKKKEERRRRERRKKKQQQLNMGNVLVMKQVAMALFEAKTR